MIKNYFDCKKIFFFLSFSYRYDKCQRRDETSKNILHALPNVGTGKGIPFQSLPNPKTSHRDSSRALPDRTTDKDLVSKSAHEMEERT